MKISLLKSLSFIAIFSAIGCVSLTMAQEAIMVGGYKITSVTEDTVVKAANAAMAAQTQKDATLKLTSILKAERQVVAGTNYRLCLAVQSGKTAEQATALVFHDLKNQYSLSKWTVGKCAGAEAETDIEAEDEMTYKGTLQAGKTSSAIVYMGEETGDLAAFCFTNNSKVGRAILAACKRNGQCEFTGTIDWDAGCKIKDERDLSASGKILTIDTVKAVAK